jgi:hypothetical protein
VIAVCQGLSPPCVALSLSKKLLRCVRLELFPWMSYNDPRNLMTCEQVLTFVHRVDGRFRN